MRFLRLTTAALVAAFLLPQTSWAQSTDTHSLTSHGVTVGTSSGTASNPNPRKHLELLNQSTTATIYCTIDGSTPVAAATANQITIPPLGGIAWAEGTIPANKVTCIASAASTPLTVLE